MYIDRLVRRTKQIDIYLWREGKYFYGDVVSCRTTYALSWSDVEVSACESKMENAAWSTENALAFMYWYVIGRWDTHCPRCSHFVSFQFTNVESMTPAMWNASPIYSIFGIFNCPVDVSNHHLWRYRNAFEWFALSRLSSNRINHWSKSVSNTLYYEMTGAWYDRYIWMKTWMNLS